MGNGRAPNDTAGCELTSKVWSRTFEEEEEEEEEEEPQLDKKMREISENLTGQAGQTPRQVGSRGAGLAYCGWGQALARD